MYRAPIRALVASAPIDSVANLDHRLRFSSTNTAPITGGSAQLDRFPGPGSCPTRPAASPSLACGDRPDRQGAGRRCSKKRVAELRPVIAAGSGGQDELCGRGDRSMLAEQCQAFQGTLGAKVLVCKTRRPRSQGAWPI